MSATEEDLSIQLGDRVYVAGGVLDGLRGRIYYLDDSLIRILSDGESHRVVDIPIVDGDLDEDLKIESIYPIQKRVSEAFVTQNDFQVGYSIETITESEELGPTYRIVSINEEEDSAVVVDETGAEKTLTFAFRGIPLDEPFVVLRVREPATPVKAESAEDEPQITEDEEGFELLEDLELPEIVEIREIPMNLRFYPDVIQRNDMLQDLLSMLDIRKQKNPLKQAEIRKLVEVMMLMRNQITKYSKSGEPEGILPSYFTSLIELLEKTNVPLARKLADAKRMLFLDHSSEHLKGKTTDPKTSTWDKVKIQYLDEVIKDSLEYTKTQIEKGSAEIISDALPSWYISLEGFFKRFFVTWDSEPQSAFIADTDFIMAPVPDFEDPNAQGLPMVSEAGKPVDKGSRIPLTVEAIGNTQLTVLRGLSSRMVRVGDVTRVVESPEFISVVGYLLFPLRYDVDLGSIRSGKLANDIGRSLQQRMTMKEIIAEKGISEIPTSGSIFHVSKTSFGNITLEDWLKGQPLYAKSLGDIAATLNSFGLASLELNVDQTKVLIDKIDKYRALVRRAIREFNEKATEDLSSLTLKNNLFLSPEAFEDLTAKLIVEPRFVKKIAEFANRLPSYRDNDLALFAFLTNYLYDLTLATLAGAAQPLAIQIRRAVRADNFHVEHLKYRVKAKKEEVGEAPLPNPCPHVKSLDLIRKVRDDTQRMQLLLKFISKFGGEKRDNWLSCQVCSKHCLCNHEILQIQEFLRPREKDVLHKDLLLTFSAGTFQGAYICGNCGQPIQEMDFDQSLEYDDEGRPMMGRAVLVDTDALAEEQLDDLLGAPVNPIEEINLANETQTMVYKVARQLMDRLGIQATSDGYRRIAQRVETHILKQPTRAQYSQIQKDLKSKGRQTLDFDIVINRLLVISTAAYSLLEIQTAIPGYTVRYTMPGCKPSFAGYPMGEEANKNGIEYLACAVGSIQRNEAPWNLTGFLKERDEKKRSALIARQIVPICTEALQSSEVTQEIAIKKEYLETHKGNSAVVKEMSLEIIPEGFLPEPFKADEIQEIRVPEAAGPREKIRAWIVQAHELAAKTVVLPELSVFTETTCCRHPIQTPSAFWQAAETSLPTLSASAKARGPVGSHLSIPFEARMLDIFRAKPNETILYRLFLKICFAGDRVGLPHEFGYDKICPHCSFVYSEEQLGLDSQQISYTQEAFQELLDIQHRRYLVAPLVLPQPTRGMALLERLAATRPAPFERWPIVLGNVILEMTKLPSEKLTEEIEIAAVFGPLSNQVEEFTQELSARLGEDAVTTITQMSSQGAAAIVESVRTYLLTPFQRLLSQFKTASLKIPKSYKLSNLTTDDIESSLRSQFEYLGDLSKRMKGLTKAKIMDARDKLAAILPIVQEELRAPVLPGGKIAMEYLLKSILFGVLTECVNPSHIPEGLDIEEEDITNSDIRARGAMQIVSVCLAKYKVESLAYSPELIREMIAYRNEIEKTRIIRKMTALSEEEKAVDQMNKRLGLGDWAVGGTKKIFAYDAEQYERERREREEMGFAAPVVDTAEDGYDVVQTGEDDS